jgi:glycosyltransferase involved in cell wall biosynthesis
MRIALVHDWFPAFRGGERVVAKMLDLFPEADIFTLFDFLTQEEKADYFKSREFNVSPMNNWVFSKKFYKHYFFLCPFFIEQFNVTEHDAVISSSAAFARGVITRPDQPHMCYVHSPIRYAWDQQFEYLDSAKLGYGPRGILFRYLLHKIRLWDVRTAFGPDLILANSSYVRERIRRIYGREAQVVFPPVEVDEVSFREDRDDYYVVASFLVPYKRIDLVIQAFNEMPNRRLLVVGDGQQARELRAIAKPNVTFTGHLPRAAFVDTIAKARGFVFAGCEDFGIVMAEAQACGTPLIAFDRGGARDIVRDFRGVAPATGLLFSRQSPQAVMDAVEEFEGKRSRISPASCRDNAMRFSVDRFNRQIADAWSQTIELKKRQFALA